MYTVTYYKLFTLLFIQWSSHTGLWKGLSRNTSSMKLSPITSMMIKKLFDDEGLKFHGGTQRIRWAHTCRINLIQIGKTWDLEMSLENVSREPAGSLMGKVHHAGFSLWEHHSIHVNRRGIVYYFDPDFHPKGNESCN